MNALIVATLALVPANWIAFSRVRRYRTITILVDCFIAICWFAHVIFEGGA